jgi:lipid A 3-O-deacylase
VQTISSLVPAGGGEMRGKVSAWGIHVFGGLEGWLVGHTVFLDGNLWQSSHSVQREWLVAEFKTGVVLDLKRVQFAFAYVARSPEFAGQGEANRYGSLSAKVEF